MVQQALRKQRDSCFDQVSLHEMYKASLKYHLPSYSCKDAVLKLQKKKKKAEGLLFHFRKYTRKEKNER